MSDLTSPQGRTAGTSSSTVDISPNNLGLVTYLSQQAVFVRTPEPFKSDNLSVVLGTMFDSYEETREYLVRNKATKRLLEYLDSMPAGTWKPEVDIEALL